MPPVSDHLRFVAAVRRRMWGHRLLESAVPAAAVAALAAAVAGRWTPTAAMPTALLVAVTVIAVLVYLRRPTLAAAAREIDAQFSWHELVQSARAVSSTRDEVGQAVIALADGHCRAARIGELSLGRVRPRTAALSAVLLIAAMAIHLSPTDVVRNSSAAADEEMAQSLDRPFAAVAPHPGLSGIHPSEPNEPTRRGSIAEDINRPARVAVANPAGRAGESTDGAGPGAAGGRTPPPAAPPADAAYTTPAPVGTTLAAGDGTSAPAVPGRGASSGVVTSATSVAASAWSTTDLPVVDSNGDHAANSSSIPPADVDLVRAFFTR